MKVYYNSKLAKRLLFGNFKTCMHLFCGHLSAGWLLLVPFTYYLLYGGEWAISYAYHMIRGDARDRWNDEAYHASAFEMEAYAHENEPEYQHKRRWFGFVKYYGKI